MNQWKNSRTLCQSMRRLNNPQRRLILMILATTSLRRSAPQRNRHIQSNLSRWFNKFFNSQITTAWWAILEARSTSSKQQLLEVIKIKRVHKKIHLKTNLTRQETFSKWFKMPLIKLCSRYSSNQANLNNKCRIINPSRWHQDFLADLLLLRWVAKASCSRHLLCKISEEFLFTSRLRCSNNRYHLTCLNNITITNLNNSRHQTSTSNVLTLMSSSWRWFACRARMCS